ncbi:MAG: DUF6531 domain-containing protein [Burkholderiales bacterium]
MAVLAGMLWCTGAAHAQTPMTLWITNVRGFGPFPPAWYPLLGRTPAEACEKHFAEVVADNARVYEYNLKTYGSDFACPGIARMVSTAPACLYDAHSSYVRPAPGLGCTTVGFPQNPPGIAFRFPTADSKAAGQAPYGSCFRANPVNLGNGNKLQTESDYEGRGTLPHQFIRTYNSRGVQAAGRLGRGWRHSYDAAVAIDEPNGTAMAHRPNGAVYAFARSGAQWMPDADISDRLERVLDASNQPAGWRYRPAGADDRVEVYDRDGRLTAIEDKAGRPLSLQYAFDVTAGVRLTAVVDSYGRTLAFGYDAAGRINQATGPAGDVHRYEYDAQGNLITAIRPDSTTRRYHHLCLTDPTGEAVPLVILIPIVGGGINAVASAISAARECNARWGDIAAAAGRGFLSGAVGTAVGLGVGIATKNPALIGSSAGLAENVTTQLLSGRGISDLDPLEATFATGFGALGGAAARAAFPPGRGRPAALSRPRGLEDFGPKSIERIRDEAAAGAVAAGLGVAATQPSGNSCGCRP